MKTRVSFFLLFMLFNGLAAADDIPVIMWGSHIQHQPAIAMKCHNGVEFMDILRKHSAVDTITFVIAEDQLSIEDLSQCRSSNGQSCFKGIQTIESKLYLPSVEDPASIIREVAKLHQMIEVSLLPSGNFSELLNHHQTKQYIFVNFDDNGFVDETKSMKLSRHDRMIVKFYEEFLSQNNDRNVMVVLTGKRATYHRRREVRDADGYPYFSQDEGATDLTNVAASEGFVWKMPQLFLYYISMEVKVRSLESKPININNVTVTTADNLNITADDAALNHKTVETSLGDVSVKEMFFNLSTDENDTFEFWITLNSDYWWIDQFKWNDAPLNTDRPISAAHGYSFHCTPRIRIGNSETVLIWQGLQIQPNFVIDNNGTTMTSFSEAFDCVGFVSPVILTGIFISFMLMCIAFIGVLCLLDIKPIDRFDNPKRKTITIVVDG